MENSSKPFNSLWTNLKQLVGIPRATIILKPRRWSIALSGFAWADDQTIETQVVDAEHSAGIPGSGSRALSKLRPRRRY
jgi:hypothetical protein